MVAGKALPRRGSQWQRVRYLFGWNAWVVHRPFLFALMAIAHAARHRCERQSIMSPKLVPATHSIIGYRAIHHQPGANISARCFIRGVRKLRRPAFGRIFEYLLSGFISRMRKGFPNLHLPLATTSDPLTPSKYQRSSAINRSAERALDYMRARTVDDRRGRYPLRTFHPLVI